MKFRLVGMDKEFHNRFKDSLRTDVNGLYLVFLIKRFVIIFSLLIIIYFFL